MMNTKKSRRSAAFKALYILPLALLVVLAFAKTASLKAQSENVQLANFSADQPVEVRQIETADCTLMEFFSMKNRIYVENFENETHVTLLIYVSSSAENIKFGKDDFKLIDDQTGDSYICRSIKGYGDSMNILLKNYEGAIIPITAVFPPLKKSLSRFAYMYNGELMHGKVFDLKEVTRKPHKIIL